MDRTYLTDLHAQVAEYKANAARMIAVFDSVHPYTLRVMFSIKKTRVRNALLEKWAGEMTKFAHFIGSEMIELPRDYIEVQPHMNPGVRRSIGAQQVNSVLGLNYEDIGQFLETEKPLVDYEWPVTLIGWLEDETISGMEMSRRFLGILFNLDTQQMRELQDVPNSYLIRTFATNLEAQ